MSRLKAEREAILYDPKLYKLIVSLAWPMAITVVAELVYEFLDMFWLGGLGSAALAAPSSIIPFMEAISVVMYAFAIVTATLVGQLTGAGRLSEASWRVSQLLLLTVSYGVLAAIVAVASLPLVLRLLRVPSNVYPLALSYGTIIALGRPLVGVFLVFNNACRAVGDTKLPMRIEVLGVAVNTVLDPVLIYPLGLGVAGAALATLASWILVAGYSLAKLAARVHGLALRLSPPDRSIIAYTLRIGGPAALEALATAASMNAMVWIVSGLGTPVLAAYSIGFILLGLCVAFSRPLAEAGGIIASQCLGAGLWDRAWRALWAGILLSVLATLAFTLVVLAFRTSFISLFAHDPETARVAEDMVLIFAPSLVLFRVYDSARTAGKSGGKTTIPAVLTMARLWGMRIPLSYILAYIAGLGEKGVWLGMALSNHVTGLIALAWLSSRKWMRRVI